jgi:hypothetical protein
MEPKEKGKAMARRKDALSEDATQVEVTDPVSEVSVPEAAIVASESAPTPEPPVDPDPSVQPAPVSRTRRSGILGPLLGGALAATGGFALSHFNVFGLVAPDQSAIVTGLNDRVAALEVSVGDSATTDALRAEIGTISARVEALEAVPPATVPDLSALEERLAAIESLPTGADASTAALAAKLAELERRLADQPAGVDQAEVNAALERLAAAEAEAQARADEAAAAAEIALRAEAMGRLRDAVAAGSGFETELAAVGDADLQAALAPHAAGVATLETLQADFPEAARLALQLDRAAAEGDGWGARFVDFLAAQTGARSLTPQDGEDADAVLSRAEFALAEGRLADAVAEVKALDPTLQAPFADWLARADARLAVTAALEGK